MNDHTVAVVDLADRYPRAELTEALDRLLSRFGLFTSLEFSADGSALFVGTGCRLHRIDPMTGRFEATLSLIASDDDDPRVDPSGREVRVLEVQETNGGVCCVRLGFDPPPGNLGTEYCQLIESDLSRFVLPGGGRRLARPELIALGDEAYPVLAPPVIDTVADVDSACVAERTGLVAVAETEDGDERRLAIFQADTGALLRALPGYPDGVWRMDLDPTGARLAVIEVPQTVDVLETGTGRVVAQVPLADGEAVLCRFGPDGDPLYVATTGPAHLSALRPGDPAARPDRLAIGVDERLRPLCLNRDGASVWAPAELVDRSWSSSLWLVPTEVTEVLVADPLRGVRAHPVRPAALRRGPVALSPAGGLLAYTVDTTLVVDRVAA
jgi:hypothetical protein